MLIVDSQIHIWQNGRMSPQHRQIPTYSIDDALAEMAAAGVDCAVIHPPGALGEAATRDGDVGRTCIEGILRAIEHTGARDSRWP